MMEVEQGYMVYLDKIIEGADLPTCLVRAAKDLQESGYLTTGDFFERLEDVEVLELTSLMNSVNTKDFHKYALDSEEAGRNLYHLSLICFVLALGEGEVQITPSFLNEALKALFLLIIIENLYREGKVLVFRENFTILESNRPIAQAIKGQM